MRTVAASSFERLSEPRALWRAWLSCRRGKRRQPRIVAFDLDADTHIFRLHRALRDGRYRPSGYRLQVVHEPKTRLVAAPEIPDRVVQTALLDDIAPVYERGFIDQSYACCTGRGPHRAILEYLRWMRRCRYRLTLDVRRYFASIRHDTLLALFARRLRDRDTLALLAAMLAKGGEVYRTPLAVRILDLENDPVSAGCGIPLGGFLSHWSGGLYLDGLDHFVKRELKVRAYLRFMDDLALFGDDRAELEEIREAIREWLQRERHLELKARRDTVCPTSEPSTYLGFRVSRSGVLPGPKTKRRLRRRLRHAATVGPEGLARTLGAYRGLFLSL